MKRRKKHLCILSAMLIFLLCPTLAYAGPKEKSQEDATLAPYFFVEGADPSKDSFPLKETKVSTTINGVIAETYVTQTYGNEGTDPINASYLFPASTKVTVHGMKMEIGDRVVTAKIKEKEEAKAEFEEAKSQGKSASLLEQQRPNVFTMKVSNIMPGDTVKIELHYTELIVPTEGTYQFVFPTVAGPRYASPASQEKAKKDQWVEAPYLKEGSRPAGKYDITVNLSTGVPITHLSCKSHQVKVEQDTDSTAQVTLSNPGDFAGNRDFILDYKLTGDQIISGLMLDKGEKENFFMLMVQPPERFNPEDVPPREYIFVLDVSGSMGGYPLDTAKELIRNLVGSLRKTDQFNLILFSGASMQMSPKPVAATKENIAYAIHLIEQQKGGGGTEMVPALEQAVSMPKEDQVARSVVIITDGYIAEEREIFDIIGKHIGTTSFFSFGIGTSVNRYLIDGIAKTGLGESFVVTDRSQAEATAGRFRAYIQSPILTGIQVGYDGFEVYDPEPPAFSTLFAQRPVVLFGKWRGEPSGTIRITGKTGRKDYVQEIPVSQVKPLAANKAISYLWARAKVERLLDYAPNEDDPVVKKEVTQLGLDYSMMTPYTSFVAVMDTVRNPGQKSTDVNQPLPLPLHVSNLAVGGVYTIGSEPGYMVLVLLGGAMVSLSILWKKKRRRLAVKRGSHDDIP